MTGVAWSMLIDAKYRRKYTRLNGYGVETSAMSFHVWN